ncbi:MAG: plastocyanin/azurin family copper-binding protein [Opitutales bacterium]
MMAPIFPRPVTLRGTTPTAFRNAAKCVFLTAVLALLVAGCNGGDSLPGADRTPSVVQVGANGVHQVTLDGTDARGYTVDTFELPAGVPVVLKLTNVGSMPRQQMAHNFVLVADDSQLFEFNLAAGTAIETDYIPAGYDDYVLAASPLAGPGETVTVTFTAPAQPGRYPFLCTFPGHYDAGMKGVLIVTASESSLGE